MPSCFLYHVLHKVLNVHLSFNAPHFNGTILPQIYKSVLGEQCPVRMTTVPQEDFVTGMQSMFSTGSENVSSAEDVLWKNSDDVGMWTGRVIRKVEDGTESYVVWGGSCR